MGKAPVAIPLLLPPSQQIAQRAFMTLSGVEWLQGGFRVEVECDGPKEKLASVYWCQAFSTVSRAVLPVDSLQRE